MRLLYLNPRDELRVCLSMESLQEACTGLGGRNSQGGEKKMERLTKIKNKKKL